MSSCDCSLLEYGIAVEYHPIQTISGSTAIPYSHHTYPPPTSGSVAPIWIGEVPTLMKMHYFYRKSDVAIVQEEERTTCPYCGNKSKMDDRGGCCACGGPK